MATFEFESTPPADAVMPPQETLPPPYTTDVRRSRTKGVVKGGVAAGVVIGILLAPLDPTPDDSPSLLGSISNKFSAATILYVTKPEPPPPPDGELLKLQTPPNLGAEHPKHKGYYMMPPSLNGAYEFDTDSCSNTNQRWGSLKLVQTIYTVAQEWEKETNGKLFLRDLNGSLAEHKSHRWGVGVDLNASTGDGKGAANMTGKRGPYSEKATVTLGKLFLRTNTLQGIWYNDKRVRLILNKYAEDNDLSNPRGIKYEENHHHHFHVDVKDKYKLPDWPAKC